MVPKGCPQGCRVVCPSEKTGISLDPISFCLDLTGYRRTATKGHESSSPPYSYLSERRGSLSVDISPTTLSRFLGRSLFVPRDCRARSHRVISRVPNPPIRSHFAATWLQLIVVLNSP